MLLGHSLTDRLARNLGVRMLAIKGPVLRAQGLRAPHRSVDVDVLVDPVGRDRLRGGLQALGWRVSTPSVPAATTLRATLVHSIQLAHERWSVEIDLHSVFPGFLASPSDVFDELWQRRATFVPASTEVMCTDLPSSAAIAALHALRHPARKADELKDLVGVLRERLDADAVRELTRLAQATGASETLAPLLVQLGVSLRDSGVPAEEVRLWRLRTTSPGVPSVGWVNEFVSTPWRRWPALLRRALWLTDHEIAMLYPQHAGHPAGLVLGRVRRLLAGLRQFPNAVHLVRAARRNT